MMLHIVLSRIEILFPVSVNMRVELAVKYVFRISERILFQSELVYCIPVPVQYVFWWQASGKAAQSVRERRVGSASTPALFNIYGSNFLLCVVCLHNSCRWHMSPHWIYFSQTQNPSRRRENGTIACHNCRMTVLSFIVQTFQSSNSGQKSSAVSISTRCLS